MDPVPVKRTRRREDPNRPCAVYRHFDDRGVLLYVGVTANLTQRWQNHPRGNGWKHLVASTEVEWFASRRLALNEESRLIRTLVPVFNREHNMTSWFPVEALYEATRAALPARPDLAALQRLYPSPILDADYWAAIEVQRCKVLDAFGVVDDETPAHRPPDTPSPGRMSSTYLRCCG